MLEVYHSGVNIHAVKIDNIPYCDFLSLEKSQLSLVFGLGQFCKTFCSSKLKRVPILNVLFHNNINVPELTWIVI